MNELHTYPKKTQEAIIDNLSDEDRRKYNVPATAGAGR
jgi:hypothetical protein